MKKKLIASFALALLLLFLFIYGVGWEDITEVILKANVRWLAVSALMFSIAMLVWAFNWKIVFTESGHALRLRKLLSFFLVASFANNITPFGQAGGEVATAYILKSRANIPYEKGLASVILLDVIGIFPFVSFAIVGIIILLTAFDLPTRAYLSFTAVLAFAIFVLYMFYWLWKRRDVAQKLLFFLTKPFRNFADKHNISLSEKLSISHLTEKVNTFYSTLDTISSKKLTLPIVVSVATIGWLFFTASCYSAFKAVGLNIPFTVLMLILPVAQLANFLPLPGGLGGNEVVFTALIVLVGGAAAVASAAVLLFRFITYWAVTFVGGAMALHLLGSRTKVEELFVSK